LGWCFQPRANFFLLAVFRAASKGAVSRKRTQRPPPRLRAVLFSAKNERREPDRGRLISLAPQSAFFVGGTDCSKSPPQLDIACGKRIRSFCSVPLEATIGDGSRPRSLQSDDMSVIKTGQSTSRKEGAPGENGVDRPTLPGEACGGLRHAQRRRLPRTSTRFPRGVFSFLVPLLSPHPCGPSGPNWKY